MRVVKEEKGKGREEEGEEINKKGVVALCCSN